MHKSKLELVLVDAVWGFYDCVAIMEMVVGVNLYWSNYIFDAVLCWISW